jgi:hypothetical protein
MAVGFLEWIFDSCCKVFQEARMNIELTDVESEILYESLVAQVVTWRTAQTGYDHAYMNALRDADLDQQTRYSALSIWITKKLWLANSLLQRL